jgi:hypothetical protein
MADPRKVSSELRRIAARLDASRSPSLSAVRRDIGRVVLAVSRPERAARVRRLAAEMVRLAQEDIEVSLWDTDEGADVESAYDFAKKRGDEPKKLEHALKSLKHDIDTFIDELKRDPSVPRKEDDEDVVTSAPKRHDIQTGRKPSEGKKSESAPGKDDTDKAMEFLEKKHGGK